MNTAKLSQKRLKRQLRRRREQKLKTRLYVAGPMGRADFEARKVSKHIQQVQQGVRLD